MLIHRMIFFHFTNRKLLVKLKTSPTLPSCKHRILKHHSKFTFIGVWPAAGEIFSGMWGYFYRKNTFLARRRRKIFGGCGVSTGECILNVFLLETAPQILKNFPPPAGE